MRYENLCKKYDLTPEEIDKMVDQICAKGISSAYGDSMALIAVVDLMTRGDIPEVVN